MTPNAEFNFWVDPEAAKIALRSGIPIVLSPLNVSRKTNLNKEWYEKLVAVDTPLTRLIRERMGPVFEKDPGRKMLMFDQVTVASLVDPSLVTTTDLYVDVDAHPRHQLRRVGGRQGALAARRGRAEDGRPARPRLGSLHPDVRGAGHPARSVTLGAARAHGQASPHRRRRQRQRRPHDLHRRVPPARARPSSRRASTSASAARAPTRPWPRASAAPTSTWWRAWAATCSAPPPSRTSRPSASTRSTSRSWRAWPAAWPRSSWRSRARTGSWWSRARTTGCCPPTWTRPRPCSSRPTASCCSSRSRCPPSITRSASRASTASSAS